ncbi:MAG TPA: diguanylate cyclase [Acidobacteriaceae bacterium]|nr:diguanylate cyclase [Acidobacteriaceae bacterium]
MPSYWIRTLLQLAASALTLWLSFAALGTHGHFLYVWPLTAVQLSIALVNWQTAHSRVAQLSAACAGEFLATVLLGMPLWIGALLSITQTIEVGCLAAILYPRISGFDDLKRGVNVLRFGAAALLVPAVVLIAALKAISVMAHATLLTSWLIVVPADTLGIAIIFPVLMFLHNGEYRSLQKLRPHLAGDIPSSLLFLVALVFIFRQTSFPLLFLAFPPLVVVLVVAGLEGAAFAGLAVAAVGCWATVHGHGPIWLIRGATEETRIIVLQVFMATVVAVAMPVGALLDERRIAESSAREAESIYKILIQNAEDMIILSTMNGERRFVSPAVKQVTGWNEEEYLALGHLGGMHPDDRDHARTVIDSIAAGKTHHTFRYRILCKDGSSRWVEAFVRSFSDAQSGRVAGYVGTIRDISTQIRSEEALFAQNEALASQNRELSDMAMRDELTGIGNRRAFNLMLDYEFARHVRSRAPLTLLMIDVDYFKKYNDTFGHPAGDRCLRLLAQTIASRVRRVTDRVARVGGEEFAALLPETDVAGARKVAADLLDAVRELGIDHSESPIGRVSVSIGISTLSPEHGGESAALIQQADRALYESKRAGRNCISVSGD